MSSGNSRPRKPQSLKMGAVIQGEGAVTNLELPQRWTIPSNEHQRKLNPFDRFSQWVRGKEDLCEVARGWENKIYPSQPNDIG